MVITKKPATKKSAKPTKSGLTVAVVDIKGKVVGNVQLPKEVFGVTVPDTFLAQAAHVYRTNKRQGTSATKTRGEVAYSTRKIYRQKGTGNARHGSRKAPIFVGGGITFGPQPRDFELKLSQSQRKKALFGALSQKVADKNMIVVKGLEKVEPKTKTIAKFLTALTIVGKSTLIGLTKEHVGVIRAARNIPQVDTENTAHFNAYAVLKHQKLIIADTALGQFTAAPQEKS